MRKNLPEWYTSFLDSFPVPTLLKNRSGEVIHANPLFLELHDLSAEDLLGNKMTDFLPSEMNSRVDQSDADLTELGMTSETALRFKKKSGGEVVVVVRKRLIELPDGSKAILGVVSDVSAYIQQEKELREKHRLLRKQQGKLQRLATLDPLTGIYNRRAFFAKADQLIETKEFDEPSIGLLMFDLDNFKQLNDRYGHSVGDKVLVEFTKLVMTCIRIHDVFARLGGEEFILLLPDAVEDSVVRVGERIRLLIEKSGCSCDTGEEVFYTTSVGGTMLLPSDDNITDAINRADNALYDAKRSGRNCLRFDSPDESEVAWSA